MILTLSMSKFIQLYVNENFNPYTKKRTVFFFVDNN